MKIFYIFKYETEQIFICIGSFDSSDAIFLVSCQYSSYFHILDKEYHPHAKTLFESSGSSEQNIPGQILEDLENLVKKMKTDRIDHSDHLNEEIMKLDGWFHASELVGLVLIKEG